MDITGGFYIPDSPPRAPSDSADTPPPPPLSLENEVANVMAGLGSFWGKVRKQSVAAYQTAEQQIDTARKDLQPLVSKARANLDQLGETTKAELHRLSEAGSSASTGVMIGADGTPVILDGPRVDKGKGVDRSGDGDEAVGPNPGAAAAAFFAKMQTQLAANPNVQGLSKNLATLQSSVQTNLSHLPASLQTNIAQLQTQFAHIDISESQKVAEGYLHKGEHWLADFSTEVAKLAKDAVKVLPPTESELSLDRSKKREERLRKAEQVALGRTDILVRRLRADSAGILLVDPAQPPPSPSSSADTDAAPAPTDTREAFSKFLQSVEDAGGFEGETWAARVANELEVAGEGETGLKASLAKLVPPTMTAEAFWSRYFFRVEQIGEDEQRRKQVLEVANEQDEDFSWDNEDEDDTPSTTAPQSTAALPSTPTPAPKPSVPAPRSPETDGEWGSASAPPSVPSSPTLQQATLDEQATPRAKVAPASTAPTSPRASSDGTSSYDVVGAASGNPSEVGEGEKKEKESDGEDSDWE